MKSRAHCRHSDRTELRRHICYRISTRGDPIAELPENPNQIPKPPGTSVDRPSIPVKDEFPRDGGLVGDVVRNGGIAESDEQVKEITRDTYGFPDAPPTAPTREERIEQANRAAEEEGLPGVNLPDEER